MSIATLSRQALLPSEPLTDCIGANTAERARKIQIAFNQLPMPQIYSVAGNVVAVGYLPERQQGDVAWRGS